MSSRRSSVQPRINWGLILLCEFLSAFLIAAAFWLERYHQWQGESLSTMTNLGATSFLAGILFLLERRFVRRVSGVAVQAAREVAEATVDARTEDVRFRLDQLDERMQELVQARNAAQDASITSLDDPTAFTVASALAHAAKLGAIAYGHITVQGSRDYRELGLTFSYGAELGNGRFGELPRDVLKVEADVYDDFRSGGSRWVIEVDWDDGDSAVDVGLRLRGQLENRGKWKGEATLDWSGALRRLQRDLEIAVRSRRRDDGPGLLQGALFGFVTPEWAITEAGVECPSTGYILDGDEFPERYGMGNLRRNRDSPAWRPDAPEGVDNELWDEVLRRAREHLPISRSIVATMAPSWVARTEPPDMPDSSARGRSRPT